MMKRNPAIKKSFAARMVLLLVICGGCGTSEYDRRLEDRIKQAKNESQFNFLSNPINIPGTQCSIRIPIKNESNKNGFEIQPLTEGTMIDGKPAEASRLKPGFIEIPGWKFTFEGTIADASGGKQPFYLYVGVLPDAQKFNYPRNLRQELSTKFNNTTDLSDVHTQTPEGREIVWKRCRATGRQSFYYIQPDNNIREVQLPGTIELFFLEENDTLMILAWRLPSGVEQSLDFQTWTGKVAGCFKLSP